MSVKRSLTVLTLAGMFGALFGCGGPVHIERLSNRPEQYEGKQIVIIARVIATRDIPLSEYDYYKVTDDTGALWVMTRRGVPLKGTRYRIEGIYKRPRGSVAGVLLGDYIIEEYERTEIEELP